MEKQQREIESLRAELEEYRKEKEQIRKILGTIGGASYDIREGILNCLFLFLLCAIFVSDIARHFWGITIPYLTSMVSLEIAVLLVSVKIIWMIHKQTKVEHFQFWILNSIEFRLNAISKKLTEMDKKDSDNENS